MSSEKHPALKKIIVTVSIVAVVILAVLFVRTIPYTITVQYKEWTVRDSVATHIAKNGSTGFGEGIILTKYIYFPSNSKNRTVEINLEVLDGTIDLLVFPSLSAYQSWLYGSITDWALAIWSNITSVSATISFENTTAIIARRANSGGAWVDGTIIAQCILN